MDSETQTAPEFINVRLEARIHSRLLLEAGRLQAQDGQRRTHSEVMEALFAEVDAARRRNVAP
jgi:hypothetical protein